MNSQVILFVITSISLSKMTRDCAMKYHGQRGKTTMVEGQNTIGSGFNEPWIGDQFAIGWGVKIP